MVEVVDYNSFDEAAQRRRQFTTWLFRAWVYLSDHKRHHAVSVQVQKMLDKADEPDYPLWGIAAEYGLIGDSILSKELMKECGIPIEGPVACTWEKAINYAPVIKLDEPIWRQIHSALGWANRNSDASVPLKNFWLWSNGGNVVRFVIREQCKEPIQGEDDATI